MFTSKTKKATAEGLEFEKETLAQIRLTLFAIQSAIGRYVGMSQARGILFHIMRIDQEMSQAAIQQKLGVDRSQVTRIVKQMEADGLVTRRPDPADNRFTLVQLTEAGYALQDEISAKIQKADATLLQGVSRADMLCTMRTLTRIRENAGRLVTDGAAEDMPRSKTKPR
jgi:DNA-binding MarR family transcriptional regulator